MERLSRMLTSTSVQSDMEARNTTASYRSMPSTTPSSPFTTRPTEQRPRVARQEDLVSEHVRFEIGQRWASRCGLTVANATTVTPVTKTPTTDPKGSFFQKGKQPAQKRSRSQSLGGGGFVGANRGWTSASSSLSGRCDARCCAAAAAKRAVAGTTRAHPTVAEILEIRDRDQAGRALGRVLCDVFFGGECRDASRMGDSSARGPVSLELLEDAALCGCVLLIFCADPAVARGLLRTLLAEGGLCDDPADLAAVARAAADLAVSRGVCAEKIAPSLELFVAGAARKAFVDAVPLDALVVCWDTFFDRVADVAAVQAADKALAIKEDAAAKEEEPSTEEEVKDAADDDKMPPSPARVVTPSDADGTAPYDEVVTVTQDDSATVVKEPSQEEVAAQEEEEDLLMVRPGVPAWVRCGVALLACCGETVKLASVGTGPEDGASIALAAMADLSKDADATCLADEIDAMDDVTLEPEAAALQIAAQLLASRRVQQRRQRPPNGDDILEPPRPGKGLSPAVINRTRAAVRGAARAVVESGRSVSAEMSLLDVVTACQKGNADSEAATDLFALACDPRNKTKDTTTASAASLDAVAALLWLEAPARSRLRACLAALDLNELDADRQSILSESDGRGLAPPELDQAFRLVTGLVAGHRRNRKWAQKRHQKELARLRRLKKKADLVAAEESFDEKDEEALTMDDDLDENVVVVADDELSPDTEEEDSSSDFFLSGLAFKFAALKLRPKPTVSLDDVEAALLSDPSVVACLLDADPPMVISQSSSSNGGTSPGRKNRRSSWGWDDTRVCGDQDFSEVYGDSSEEHKLSALDEDNEGGTARAPSRRSTFSKSPNGRPLPPGTAKLRDQVGCGTRRQPPQQLGHSPDPVKSPGAGGCLFCRPPQDKAPRPIVGQPLEPDESASNVGRHRNQPAPPGGDKPCIIS